MTPPESCIFYQDPKCLLKADACDLKCDAVQNGNDIQSSDEIDKLIEWRIEGEHHGETRLELKSD